jgi:hypothetical protein
MLRVGVMFATLPLFTMLVIDAVPRGGFSLAREQSTR